MCELLDEADEYDLQARMSINIALSLRHEYLKQKGWEIDGEMIGPTMSYFYKKDDMIFTDEDYALDYEADLNDKG